MKLEKNQIAIELTAEYEEMLQSECTSFEEIMYNDCKIDNIEKKILDDNTRCEVYVMDDVIRFIKNIFEHKEEIEFLIRTISVGITVGKLIKKYFNKKNNISVNEGNINKIEDVKINEVEDINFRILSENPR